MKYALIQRLTNDHSNDKNKRKRQRTELCTLQYMQDIETLIFFMIDKSDYILMWCTYVHRLFPPSHTEGKTPENQVIRFYSLR